MGQMASSNGTLKSVGVSQAHELHCNSGYLYLDVRTPEEYSAGHPPGSINIPYMVKGPLGLSLNTDFAMNVKGRLEPSSPILVGCKSGMRSQKAASQLAEEGFTDVVNVEGGFLQWQAKGLPVSNET